MRARTLGNLAFFQVVYLIVVILFGAWVRATGSGAGCGSHWPLCNGELIPTDPGIKTLTEYTHRITSGLSLPFALLVWWLIRRSSVSGHRARKAALGTVVFVILEGLLGAGLVLFEHVAQNLSTYRAISMSLHLVNTFTLMAFATFTWYWCRDLSESPVLQKRHLDRQVRLFQWSGLFSLIFIGVSGAITALGDTLFPVSHPSEALSLGFTSGEHLFIKLRIWHPFIAIAVSSWLVYSSRNIARTFQDLRPLASILTMLILAQLLLGYLNVQLMAPTWLQLVHLLFAESIWITFILMVATLSYSWSSGGINTTLKASEPSLAKKKPAYGKL